MRPRTLLLPLLLTALAAGRPAAADANAITPGALYPERATVHSLGVRWLFSGDANANAVVAVAYRRAGEKAWRDAQPLLRVDGEVSDADNHPFRAGRLFAGSVLGLEPGASYQVRLRLSDPDGGGVERVLEMRTRPIPVLAAPVRTMHVYPQGYSGRRHAPAFEDLRTAARQARAGDLVLVHAGIYRGAIAIAGRGTAEQPVVFRAAGDGEPILDGGGVDGQIVDAQGGRDNVWLEGLTIRNGRMGIKANGTSGLVVRRCRIEDVNYGIITYSFDCRGWYVADNTIVGRVKSWYPREDSSDTGIDCPGAGHDVCYNRVRKFWDGISTDNVGAPKPEWEAVADPPQVAIDLYNNDVSECLDDGIEADNLLHNCRVLSNRICSVHTGLSAQPSHGGPLYFVRNCIYNVTNTPLKLHNYSTGVLVYHNTCIAARQAFTSSPPAWQNSTLRNNLLLGRGRYALETGSPDPRTTLDYDGFGRTEDPSLLLKWSADGGKTWGRYATPAAFASATGHEAHGRIVDLTIFVKVALPAEDVTYTPDAFDLRLKPGSVAVDAGERLPNVNDGFLGAAPDLGCYELGAPATEYGPRPAGRDRN